MKVKSLFISDVHLGSKSSNAEQVLRVLKKIESEKIYLLGDIIDMWALSKNPYWHSSHNTVIQKLLKKSRSGVEVVYVPGNHDFPVREYDGIDFGNILIKKEVVYKTVDGLNFLLVHGDEFDIFATKAMWLTHLGSRGYDFLLWIGRHISTVRRKLGFTNHWSFSKWTKYKVKQAISFISDYEKSISRALAEDGLDGVICGHIHHPEIKEFGEFVYINCGDFVESNTAIVEHLDGRFEIIYSEAMNSEEDISRY